MKVAVCDDNIPFLEEMKEILLREGLVKNVITYSNPEHLIGDIKEFDDFDLVFMDLEWGCKKTGLYWGEEIYKLMPHLPVVFITGYNDRFAQHILLTNVNLLGYLTKPVHTDILHRYLVKADSLHDKIEYLVMNIQGRTVSVHTKDIIYIESEAHKVMVHTEQETYTTYEKLSEVKERLSDDFAQCHKSFLVNMNCISVIDSKALVLKNKIELPVSRTFSVQLRKEFFEFARKKI